MLYVFSFLLLGLVLGFFTRKYHSINKIGQVLLSIAINILLFVIGFNLGNHPNLIQNIYILGKDALLITIFVFISCVLVSYLVYKLTTKK